MADYPVLKADGGVCFASADAFRAHYTAFLSQGALMAVLQRKLAAFEKLQLRLEVPGSSPLTFAGEVTSLMGDTALIRLVPFEASHKASLKTAADSARDAAPAPAPAPVVSPTPAPMPSQTAVSATMVGLRTVAAPMVLPPKGDFVNPLLPQDFLMLPITSPPTPAQLAKPAVVMLLMSLINRKAEMLALHLRSKGGKDCEVSIIEGDWALSALPPDATMRVLAEPEGTYEVRTIPEEPKVRYRVATPALSMSLLKEYSKRFLEPQYAAAMSGRHGRSAKMNGRGRNALHALGLSEVQHRIANRMLTGQYSLDEVLNNGVGVRSAWQMIVLLQVVGGLEWMDPPPRQNIMVDEMQTTLSRIKGQDHFSAMGLHYTSSPQTIARAHERLRSQYGPGSPAQRLSAQVADAVWAHMEKCYSIIGNPTSRRAYRAQAFSNMRLDYAAQLVYDQARLAEMRREYGYAMDMMEAVLELNPTREFLEEMRRIQAESRAPSK